MAGHGLGAGSCVPLKGADGGVVAEILYTLQDRTAKGIKTRSEVLRTLCDHLRRAGIATVDDCDHGGLRPHHSELALAISASVRRLIATPETDRLKDVWDLAVFGRPGRLHFEKIRHPAFKESLKIWALDDLPAKSWARCPAARWERGGTAGAGQGRCRVRVR